MSFFIHQKYYLPRAKWLALFVFLLNCQPAFSRNNNEAEAEKNLLLPYQSALGGYHSYKEQPVSSWREINDEVEKIGGWRAYAREASKSEADQVEVKDKTDTLPANKANGNLHGGGHE